MAQNWKASFRVDTRAQIPFPAPRSLRAFEELSLKPIFPDPQLVELVVELDPHLPVPRYGVPHLLGVVPELKGGLHIIGSRDGDGADPEPPRLKAVDVTLDLDESWVPLHRFNFVLDFQDLKQNRLSIY